MRSLVLLTLAGLTAPAFAQTTAPAASGPILRAEFLAERGQEFAQIDADKDGIVTTAEVEAARARAADRISERRAEAMFGQLDKDKSGQLSKEEFAAGMKVAAERLPPSPILRLDTDKNGRITRAEFDKGLGGDFDRADKNGDGRLTPEEVRAASAAQGR